MHIIYRKSSTYRTTYLIQYKLSTKSSRNNSIHVQFINQIKCLKNNTQILIDSYPAENCSSLFVVCCF